MLTLKDRIFYKQAKYSLILILLCSLLFSVFQIAMDWQEEKKTIESRIWATLDIVENTATVAAYTLDSNLADQVVTGLMRSQSYCRVELNDDLNNMLARSNRVVEPLLYQWILDSFLDGLTRRYVLPLQQSGVFVGQIWVIIDTTVVLSDFIDRNIRLVTTLFLSALLLGFIMLLLFFFQTSQPLSKLITQLVDLEKNENQSDRLHFQALSRADEFGVLSQTFTALWHKRRRFEKKLAKSEAYFKAVLRQSSDCMLLTDLKGRIHDCNDAACRLLNYDEDDLLKLSIQNIDSQQTIENLQKWSKNSHDELKTFEAQYKRSDGSYFSVEVHGNIIKLGKELFFLASVRDITKLKEDQEKMNFLAYYDALTSLPNRRFLHKHLENVVELARSNGHVGALLFIDLDRFKAINDSMGHLVGDKLLVEAAKRILEPLSKTDIAARIGGDEFVVLLPNLSTPASKAKDTVSNLAEILLLSLERAFIIEETDLFISASIGISLFPMSQTDGMNILQHADTAMYQAKENGRNGYFFYHNEMQQEVSQRSQLEQALHIGLDNDEFYLVYQPQVGGDGQLIGFEALLRWNSQELGNVPPSDFITVAEEIGLIESLGQWVMEEAFAQLKKWQDDGLPPYFKSVAINISPYQFAKDNFVQQVLEAIDNTGVDPSSIELEITEGMLVKDIPSVTSKMQDLKSLGIRFAIDDFGTAYSSLRYLQYLPLDQLKIDQSFIRDLTDDPSSQVIVNTIVSMASHMNLAVLAEGVETNKEKGILENLGCKRFQGYHFDRPLNKEVATQYLLEKKNFILDRDEIDVLSDLVSL